MIIKCCMCKKIIGEKEPYESTLITHTYCEECGAKVEKEIQDYKKAIGYNAELLATTKIDIVR